ncbi:T9SS type A sorting domain-containing protein [Aureispira anguillae]|nr:T9SS type A sorting domain-containing protein [Aureispira anguillae]
MRGILIVVLCLLVEVTFCQVVTFNKRMELGCGNTILTGLEVTDSCYYVTGIARDSITCQLGALFTRYDSLGNLLFYTINIGYETWFPYLRTNLKNELVSAPYFYDSTGMYGGIFYYDSVGTGAIKPFDHPYTVGTFIRPDDMRITQDSGYLVTNSINDSSGVGDISILKLDKNVEKEWHITRGVLNYVEHTPCVYVDSDNSYIIGYQQDNLSGVNINYTVRSKLEKIDSLGNSVWVYQSPNTQQIHGVNDLIKSKDGGWVIASAWGSERLGATGTWSTPIQEAYVYKLDSSRNFLWGTKFHSDALTTANFQKIVALEDSSLVAFGTVVRLYPQPNPIYNIIHGRIVKLSPNGDSIWSREYEYLNAANSAYTIYDAERTPDGGFLICGEANIIGTGVHQQGWLLKLDEEGCLVPGCHLVSGVLPTQRPAALNLLLYPNPTTDYLNVHYYNPSPQEDLSFRVLDVQGRLLKEYKTYDQSDKTYILSVYDLEAGVYILELRQKGALIGSEEFLKR